MRCALYVRVSTEEQVKHGYSIAAQIEKLEAYCISQGWTMAGDVYIDEGYSAKDLKRPHFQRMITEVKKGHIDVVLVYRLDRLTRSVSNLYEILQELDNYNCKFKSATEVYDTTNAMGRLFITLVAAIAQWERENTAERVRMGMEKKVKLGSWKGGTPPYGYKVTGGELIVDKEEAKTVREIFKLARTIGFYTLAKQLTAKGIPPRHAGEWHVDSVRDIANNPTYAGYLMFNDNPKDIKKPPRERQLFEGHQERIIDRAEFWELQDILDLRRTSGGKRQTSDYYFSTLLTCARCGHSMSGHRVGKKKNYRCTGKKTGKTCNSHMILEDNLVQTVFAQWDDLVGDFSSSEGVTEFPTEHLQSLKAALTFVQKLMRKKKVMYENDVIDIDELMQETENLRKKEQELQREITTIEQNDNGNNVALKSLLLNIDQLWFKANEYERKQLMTSIFEQLVIDTKDDYQSSKQAREIIIVSAK